jgi:hypothetical protein
MLARPSRTQDPASLAEAIERLRRASDLYYQTGLGGLIAQFGRPAVEAAMCLHVRALAAKGGSVVPFKKFAPGR